MTQPSTTAFRLSHAKRLDAHQADAAVAVRARSAHELVVGRAQALAVEVVGRAEPVEDHAAGRDASVGGHRQHLVDSALELAARKQLGEQPAQRPVEVHRGPRQALAGGDGDREGVDRDVGGRGGDERDLHQALNPTEPVAPGARRRARARGRHAARCRGGARRAAMWMRQPGLSDATTVQPVLAIASSFHSREAGRHPWPIEAEGAAEAAAVGDVRDVDHLVAGQAEQPPRLGLEAELPQGLARVVVGDLEAGARLAQRARAAAVSRSSAKRVESRKRERSGSSAAAPQSGASMVKAPKHEADGVTIRPLESRRLSSEVVVQLGPAGEVAGVGRDQAAAPLTLGKPNLVAGGVCDLS